MDRAIYRALGTEQRIAHLNREMTAGKKLWAICKEIGIADNVSTDFKKKGYIRNQDGLFIKQEQMGLDPLQELAAAQETTENEGASIMPIKEDKPPGGKIETTEHEENEPRRVGRPSRSGEKPKKLTIEISQETYKALMFYKIDQGLYVNGFIEDLIKSSVPEKYFKPL